MQPVPAGAASVDKSSGLPGLALCLLIHLLIIVYVSRLRTSSVQRAVLRIFVWRVPALPPDPANPRPANRHPLASQCSLAALRPECSAVHQRVHKCAATQNNSPVCVDTKHSRALLSTFCYEYSVHSLLTLCTLGMLCTLQVVSVSVSDKH